MNCYVIKLKIRGEHPQAMSVHIKAQTAEDAFFVISKTEHGMAYLGMQACTEHLTRPPIGIMPAQLAKEHRIIELMDAMRRYIDAGTPITAEWRDELYQLLCDRDRKPIDFNPDWFKGLA